MIGSVTVTTLYVHVRVVLFLHVHLMYCPPSSSVDIPDALTEVEVTALNATGVRVSWTEPENKDALNLLYYKVCVGVWVW